VSTAFGDWQCAWRFSAERFVQSSLHSLPGSKARRLASVEGLVLDWLSVGLQPWFGQSQRSKPRECASWPGIGKWHRAVGSSPADDFAACYVARSGSWVRTAPAAAGLVRGGWFWTRISPDSGKCMGRARLVVFHRATPRPGPGTGLSNRHNSGVLGVIGSGGRPHFVPDLLPAPSPRQAPRIGSDGGMSRACTALARWLCAVGTLM
jgi:hypothetical protein